MKKNYILLSGLLLAVVLSFVSLNKLHAQLYINEFMASNDTAFAGLLGDYADWIEIYNSGSADVSLNGYYLSDNLADTNSWYQIPSTYSDSVTVPAGGYIVFYANKKENISIMCLNFKLKGSGEQIGLWNPDKVVVDTLTFGAQTTDVSYGRFPDGSNNWFFMHTYTPGAANQHTTGINVINQATISLQNYPNPFKNSCKINFSINTSQNIKLSIYNLAGKQIRVLTNMFYNAGNHSITWNATSLQAGIYYYKLQTTNSCVVKKAMLIE